MSGLRTFIVAAVWPEHSGQRPGKTGVQLRGPPKIFRSPARPIETLGMGVLLSALG